jgi:alpha-L-fucosidase
LFFTRKGSDLYIILPDWPEGNILLKGINPSGSIKAGLLGSSVPVSVKRSGNGLVIVPPELTPDDFQQVYVFKLSNIIK